MSSNNNTDVAASRYLDDERFHRNFTLPPNDSRSSELKVTYADFGHQNDERVLLFCGPLFGSRYVLTPKDKLAQRYGVRVISPDRPGFGGTTDVEPGDRVRVWLDIVQALLQHLGIKQVSILGYSCGSIYAMNVLLHLRHLLHPTHPYVALCTPWVHPSHSAVSVLKLVGLLPNALVGNYDRLVQFFQGSLGLAFQFSDFVGTMPSLIRGSDFLAPGADPDDVALEESLLPELISRFQKEDLRGLGKDAILLLKRDENPGCWGIWNDYDTLVPSLAQAERELRTGDSGTTISPLQVDVFFAESDTIIGTTAAPAWFDNCWGPEQRGDFINYSSVTVPKTSHNAILDLRYGVVERIFQAMSNQDVGRSTCS
ncbi:Alpha/Beta hydrolase protein [Xylaria flabelliformis]|nr:Alpha/Beta hydrolase protein [Xylaria flabelliformis]